MLDTLRQIQTPEGVVLSLRPAGPVPRAWAWSIDFIIRIGLVLLSAMSLVWLAEAGLGLFFLCLFLAFWGYPVLFEVLRDGQTIGKRLMGLRVVCANGAPVGWIPSIVRNLMRTVDLFPAFYGFGLAASLIDPHARRLGDLVAGTLVVYAEAPAMPSHAPVVESQLPAQVLLPEEQAALVAFAERSPQLTFERQEELAGLLAPITGVAGAAAITRLFGYANALLGRR